MPTPQMQPNAWTKAEHIGPEGPSTPLPTPAQEQDPIRKLIQLAGLADPFGLGQNKQGMSPASMGGLPEGLNPGAIREAVTTMGVPWAEGEASNVADGMTGAVSGLKNAMKVSAPVELSDQLQAMPDRSALMQAARDRAARARSFHFNTPFKE